MNPNEFNKYAIKHHGISSATLHNYSTHMGRKTTALTPYIIEERPMNVASMDVFSRLMMDRGQYRYSTVIVSGKHRP
jgi:ATP-dependent Clp protease, protease subunit